VVAIVIKVKVFSLHLSFIKQHCVFGKMSDKMDPEQVIMGGVFSLMGIGTMLFADKIIPLGFQGYNTQMHSPQLSITFRCFGAQATLCGLLLLSQKMTKNTFRTWGLAMLPFFVFDYVAWEKGMITNLGAIGDALGNVVFVTCSYIGYKRAEEDESKSRK
jgi:hypothetical protein